MKHGTCRLNTCTIAHTPRRIRPDKILQHHNLKVISKIYPVQIHPPELRKPISTEQQPEDDIRSAVCSKPAKAWTTSIGILVCQVQCQTNGTHLARKVVRQMLPKRLKSAHEIHGESSNQRQPIMRGGQHARVNAVHAQALPYTKTLPNKYSDAHRRLHTSTGPKWPLQHVQTDPAEWPTSPAISQR